MMRRQAPPGGLATPGLGRALAGTQAVRSAPSQDTVQPRRHRLGRRNNSASLGNPSSVPSTPRDTSLPPDTSPPAGPASSGRAGPTRAPRAPLLSSLPLHLEAARPRPDGTQPPTSDFTQLTTPHLRSVDALRIASFNCEGSLLPLSVTCADTKLTKLLWLFQHLGLDFLLLQETKVTAAKLSTFMARFRAAGTVLDADGVEAVSPFHVYTCPANNDGTCGTMIITTSSWAALQPKHTPLPLGRGQLLEIKGSDEHRLLITNFYNKCGGAQDTASYNHAKNILSHTQTTLRALRRNVNLRVIMGGDFNGCWDASEDRHTPTDGDFKLQGAIHRFAAGTGLHHVPASATRDIQSEYTLRANLTDVHAGSPNPPCCRRDVSATPVAKHMCPARVDFFLMSRHADTGTALRGTATLRQHALGLSSEHSLILLDLDRPTLLGRLDTVERRTTLRAVKRTPPMCSSRLRNHAAWLDAIALQQGVLATASRLLQTLADPQTASPTPREQTAAKATMDEALALCTSACRSASKAANPEVYDSRPTRRRMNKPISEQERLRSGLHAVCRAYEQSGRRPSHVIHNVARSHTLPWEFHPPAVSLGYRTQADVDAEWETWHSTARLRHREVRTSMHAARRALGLSLAADRRAKILNEVTDAPTKAMYDNVFASKGVTVSPTQSVTVTKPDGSTSVSPSAADVHAECVRYFRSLVCTSRWNRPPTSPDRTGTLEERRDLPDPRSTPDDLQAVIDERSDTEYPALTRQIDPDRWQLLLRKARRGKAPGPSGLTLELILDAPPWFQEFFRLLCNRCLAFEIVPTDWHKGLLSPLLKDAAKGTALTNCRPIMLLEAAFKLLTLHLNDSIQDAWNLRSPIHPFQMGFARGRGTANALKIVQLLLETRLTDAQATHVAYLDLASAFCSVPHWATSQALTRLNVPEWAVRLMGNIDAGGRTQVNTAHGITEAFPEEGGVRQGCLLSPTKFIAWADILLTWLHKHPPDGINDITVPSSSEGSRHVLHAIFYADDMFLAASNHRPCRPR